MLRELAAEGLTVNETCEKLGVCYNTVYNKACLYGIAFKRSEKSGSRLTAIALSEAVHNGLTSYDVAKRFNVSEIYARTVARHHDLLLANMRPKRTGNFRGRSPKPEPVSRTEAPQETPPSPAMVRLAEFDSIARRAVARKRGELTEGEQGLGERVTVDLRLYSHNRFR